MLPLHPFTRLTCLSLLWLASACRAAHVPHPEYSGCHPACPGAKQASVGDAGAGLRGAPPQALTQLAVASARAPSTEAYLCPMHLHVGASEPGRCPECKMKLVPRAQALGHDHGE